MTLNNGFEKEYAVYQEIAQRNELEVLRELKESKVNLAAFIQAGKVQRSELIKTLATLMSIDDEMAKREARKDSETYYWIPEFSDAILQMGFIALVREHLPQMQTK